MKTLHRRCAGLDVHSDSVVACVRLTVRTKVSHEVRRFSTATRDLLELADWLAAQGITHVAMEATGGHSWHARSLNTFSVFRKRWRTPTSS
jgi:transposase